MLNQLLLSPEIQTFIRENLHASPAELMLQRDRYPDWPMAEIVEQIQALNKVKNKIPSWFEIPHLLYEPLAIEQCSSEATALYKSQLLTGKSLADLTGGLGVDTFYFAQNFTEVYHVEPNTALQTKVKHNFTTLGVDRVHFLNEKAEDFLQRNLSVNAFYLDPSRRDVQGGKVFRLEDMLPPVPEVLPRLLARSSEILIKLSPWLDIEQAVQRLNQAIAEKQENFIQEIHVVEYEREVKELLFRIAPQATEEPKIACAILESTNKSLNFDFYKSEETQAHVHYSEPQKYILEPFPSILKAGAFKLFAQRYQLHKLHPNSHLYTGTQLPADKTVIPARMFELMAISNYQKKAFRKIFPKDKANLTTRNFPESVAQIRKKLGLQEGGEDYLFATRNLEGKPMVLITQKL